MRLSTCGVVLLALAGGCAPKPPPAPLARIVASWQRWDPSWDARTRVAVVGWGDRSLRADTWVGSARLYGSVDGVRVGEVVRGATGARVVLLLDGALLPFFAEGRRYLVLLDPTPEDAGELVQDAGAGLAYLHRDSVVAVVDLDETEPEAALRTGTSRRTAGAFTPARWRAVRTSPTPDFAAIDALLAALEAEVLVPGRTAAEVAQFLGSPDYWDGPSVVTWWTSRAAHEQTRDGGIAADLTLAFDRAGRLVRASSVPARYELKAAGDLKIFRVRPLEPEELRAAGLRRVEKELVPEPP